MVRFAVLALVAAAVGLVASNASAQGLILNLPKDGQWVRFEGTVKQVELRPDAPEGDVSMEWIQHLTIKSVGTETAEFPPGSGKRIPCRWIEIKIVTGKPSESGIDPGPVGERIYKVLVPESRVIGQVADGDKIPFSFLDIVKGYRKIGPDVTPISAGALQVYPVIAPLMHYDALESAGGGTEEVQVPNGTVKAQKFKAVCQFESAVARTTNNAEIWRCDPSSVPFGLVRWVVKTTMAKKGSTQPRSTFKSTTQLTVDMSAHEWGTGAKSELATN